MNMTESCSLKHFLRNLHLDLIFLSIISKQLALPQLCLLLTMPESAGQQRGWKRFTTLPTTDRRLL